ncbi:glycosyltransferase family 2 protein [Roseisolibacter sp. H3M3-2]|uniref:glycosyltransferase family 2 protein n=1 Tax=Roseisolibacter sp. H3M3-2 TaxID=3031323 RepID=UPI0023D9B443|nr:glycosyltransferase family 2 protein [Roseisolibacter sp. H3M3-2]MDF1501553.1 glycosyltransferase family 2 protein [Roseisolibacter sp. H3M3-2]
MTPDPLPITVIVPCRNEAQNLELLLPQLVGMAAEVIVVDGHSTDGTPELVGRFPFRYVRDNGRGKGDGVRVGIAEARTGVCVLIDADMSHDPGDIPGLVRPILDGEADLVLGSRMRGGGDEFVATFMELVRLAGNMGLTWLINLRCGARLSDSQNGYRAARTSLLRALDLSAVRHTIELEMTMRALRAGARVAEHPTHEYPRRFGRSSLSVTRQGLLFLGVFLRECVRPLRSTWTAPEPQAARVVGEVGG